MRRSPSRGPYFPFCRKVAGSHRRLFCSVRNKKRISDFSSKSFSGGHTESHRDPAGSRGDPSYPRGDTRFDFKERDRSNKRFSESLFVSDLRVILNLKEFNLFISTQHFRMETLNVILPQLSASDWDLKDAYLHVPIHSSSRRFLGFQFMGKTFQYKVLPFGLKDSPWVFTRVVATLVGHLRRLVLRLFYYLDDWLLVAESRVLLESHLRTTLRAQSVGSPGGDSGSRQGSFGYSPLVAEISRPPCQLRGHSPQLQAADEASSASSFAVFHPLGRPSGQACSLESRDQGVVQGVGLSFSPSRRETVLPASSVSGDHHGRVRSRVGGGGGSSPSPCVRGLVEGGGSGPYQFSGIESGSSSFAESRISCSGSFGSDSFGQHDGGILHQSSGRNSFLIPVSAGLGPVGMVPSAKNFSSCGSHSGSRECCDGFSLQGKIPSCKMGSELRRVSDDLSLVFSSSGDRLVRVCSQLPAPEVLLSEPGCSGVEDRCSVVSLDGPSTVRFSSFLSSPQDLGQDSPGRSRPSLGSSVLASETLVSSSPETLGGPSEDFAIAYRPSGATHVFDSSPQGGKSSSFFIASFRQQGEEAGLSRRAAQFAAEALRQSTRDTYVSRLVSFREWCSRMPCDPSSAPLGTVADFLISRFDKGCAVVTLRSYRSAIASCHRGFRDGSSVSDSKFLTRLFQSFFLKRPSTKTLLPVWSLPAVLKALASAPFDPLHKASLRLLTLKTAFLVAIASGHRVSSLQALCVDPGHLRWEASGVRLIPRMGFIAKNQSLKSGSVEIFLPAISTLSSVEEDKVWCPVRALKWYVDRTKSIRASSSLFVATIAPHRG